MHLSKPCIPNSKLAACKIPCIKVPEVGQYLLRASCTLKQCTNAGLGRHYVGAAPPGSTKCPAAPNKCICPNGVGSTSRDCKKHEGPGCKNCKDGYFLNADKTKCLRTVPFPPILCHMPFVKTFTLIFSLPNNHLTHLHFRM